MAMTTGIAGAEPPFKPLFDAALRRHLERAGRDPQLEKAVQLALERLAERPAARPPDVATRPSRRRPDLPPRP